MKRPRPRRIIFAGNGALFTPPCLASDSVTSLFLSRFLINHGARPHQVRHQLVPVPRHLDFLLLLLRFVDAPVHQVHEGLDVRIFLPDLNDLLLLVVVGQAALPFFFFIKVGAARVVTGAAYVVIDNISQDAASWGECNCHQAVGWLGSIWMLGRCIATR